MPIPSKARTGREAHPTNGAVVRHHSASRTALGGDTCRNWLKVFAAAGVETVGPAGVHSAQQAVLQRGILVDLVREQLDEVDVAMLNKVPNVVCQVTGDVTDQHS